jgi:hypothetical protein
VSRKNRRKTSTSIARAKNLKPHQVGVVGQEVYFFAESESQMIVTGHPSEVRVSKVTEQDTELTIKATLLNRLFQNLGELTKEIDKGKVNVYLCVEVDKAFLGPEVVSGVEELPGQGLYYAISDAKLKGLLTETYKIVVNDEVESD